MMWPVSTDCQPAPGVVIAVGGVAGSGKSTLGRALATTLGAPLLDLDSMTNPLLESLPDEALGGHWLASPHTGAIRDGRYAALRAVVRDTVATAGSAVLVAPFTAELRGEDDFKALREAAHPAELRMIHLAGDTELFAARRAARGFERDLHREREIPEIPGAPVISVDAELTTEQQLLRVLTDLGHRVPIEPGHALLATGFDAVMFDLDGTLIDSTASVLRAWRRFAQETGVPVDAVAQNHGRPAKALIGMLFPAEQVEDRIARITDLEVEEAATVMPIRGAVEFFTGVPEHLRAVVTSGGTRLATARMRAAGIPVPPIKVTADDIVHGKPDPEPFLLGAERLGVDPKRCLACEDTPAGIASAKAAGCRVLAVTGTVPVAELAGADLIVDGFDRVTVDSAGGTLRLRLLDVSR